MPKNEAVSQNLSGVMENARYIVLQKNDSSLDAKRLSDSNILRVSLKSQTRDQAQKLGSEQATSLITEMSRFYNIKTELDMRILRNPTPRYVTSYNPALLAFLSIISGLLVTFFSFGITYFTIKPKQKTTKIFTFSDFSKNYRKEKERIIFYPEPKKRKEAHVSESIMPSAKAPAPENLPVAEKTVSDKFSGNIYFKETKEEKQKLTPEQAKERLNQLLSGKM